MVLVVVFALPRFCTMGGAMSRSVVLLECGVCICYLASGNVLLVAVCTFPYVRLTADVFGPSGGARASMQVVCRNISADDCHKKI